MFLPKDLDEAEQSIRFSGGMAKPKRTTLFLLRRVGKEGGAVYRFQMFESIEQKNIQARENHQSKHVFKQKHDAETK